MQKYQYVNLVDLEKCCKMSIWLQNWASIQQRTSLDKFCIFWLENWSLIRSQTTVFNSNFPAKNCRTCRGSFFAVSKPNFATKYSFCSIFRDLQDKHTFAPLQSQGFRKTRPTFFTRMNNAFHFIHSIHFYQNCDEFFAEFLHSERCKSR